MRQALIELIAVWLYIALCILLALVLVGCNSEKIDDAYKTHYQAPSDPCLPCPDTVGLDRYPFVAWSEDGVEYYGYWHVPVIEYRMPPGLWVNVWQTVFTDTVQGVAWTQYEFWLPDSLGCPDSVFILSKRQRDTGYIEIPLHRSLDLVPTDQDSLRYEIELKKDSP